MALHEEKMDEGWFGDKWNQVKTSYNTMTNDTNQDKSFGDKVAAAKKNWSSQSELNDMNNLVTLIKQFADNRAINPTDTIEQVIWKMQSIRGNRASQISRRGGTYYK